MEIFIFFAKSTGILSLFYVVYWVILQKNTLFTAKRYYLIAGLLAAVIFPFLQFTKTVYVTLPPSDSNFITPSEDFLLPLDTVTGPVEMASTIDGWQVVFVIYAIGCLVMLSSFVHQLRSLNVLLRSGKIMKKQGFTYVTTTKNISPFSFFFYILYNPERHTEQELQMILTHEQAHVQQWHTLDMLIASLLLILQWCNPLAWYYKKSVEQNLEYLADRHAIQQLTNPKEYQRTLVKVSSPIYRPALTTHFYQSFIKKRIVMLNKTPSRNTQLWKLGLILPLLALFMYSFQVKEVTAYVKKENPAFAKVKKNPLVPSDIGDASVISENFDQTNAPAESTSNTALEALTTMPNQTTVSSGERPSFTEKQKTDTQTTKTVYTPKDSLQTNYRFTITKETTVEELALLKQLLKEKFNGMLDYGGLDFNAYGEITSIRLDFKDAQGNSKNYTVQSTSPIPPIVIYRNPDGSSGITAGRLTNEKNTVRAEGRASMMPQRAAIRLRQDSVRADMNVRRDSLLKVMRSRRDSLHTSSRSSLRGRAYLDSMRQQMTQRRDSLRGLQNEQRATKNGLGNSKKAGYLMVDGAVFYYVKKSADTIHYYDRWGTQIEKDDPRYTALTTAPPYEKEKVKTEVKEKIKAKKKKEPRTMQVDLSKDGIYYVNGKKVTYKNVHKIDPDDIQEINVLKGKAAIKQYGKKGKNGVILIKTKE